MAEIKKDATKYLQPTEVLDSRYRLTAKHVDEGVVEGRVRYGVWVPPDIDMTDYTTHKVKVQDLSRIDLLAYDYYGDVTLWWVIANVNNIKNPLIELVPGTELKIPTKAAVMEALAEVIKE